MELRSRKRSATTGLLCGVLLATLAFANPAKRPVLRRNRPGQCGLRSARGLDPEGLELLLHQQLHDRFPLLSTRPGGASYEVRPPSRRE